MQGAIVLKQVVQPGKLIMACPKATLLSFCLTGIVCVLVRNVLLGLWVFLILQSIVIFLSYRDPYWLDTLLAFSKCRKTHPLNQPGNRYEP
jgi:hypothetical protein